MVTARYYEDRMKELKDLYEKSPDQVKKQMDQLNIETLASLGYSEGAKIYSEITGVRLKYECNG